MRKNIIAIFLLIMSITACSSNNKTIITNCSLIDNQTLSGYNLEKEYNIYSRKDVVSKVIINQKIASDDEKQLKTFKEKIENQYDLYNKNYGGYHYTVEIKDNILSAKITIDYEKTNLKKFTKDNIAMKEYLNKDYILSLENAKRMYEVSGAVCK